MQGVVEGDQQLPVDSLCQMRLHCYLVGSWGRLLVRVMQQEAVRCFLTMEFKSQYWKWQMKKDLMMMYMIVSVAG